MLKVLQTREFIAWRDGLKDARAKARIADRILRLEGGNFGDAKPIGEGLSELRIHYGPGYRLYLVRRGNTLVILLGGGIKRTQAKDVKAAKSLASLLK
ncbi:MAG: type II toxin-antitoxin system RelE/ParE family toxin [Litorimonas sp.]